MAKTNIEWCDYSYNPIRGCTPISEGCNNCYAARMAKRLIKMPGSGYENFEPAITSQLFTFSKVRKFKKGSSVFLVSMGDIFHNEFNYTRDSMFNVRDILFKNVKIFSEYNFLILTKRPQTMALLFDEHEVPKNLWLGVSVESDKYLHRIETLKSIEHNQKFVSFEPLISPMPKVNLDGIQWAICGGETGPGRRTFNEEWAWVILKECRRINIPFFFKSVGTKTVPNWNKLFNKTYNEFPEGLNGKN